MNCIGPATCDDMTQAEQENHNESVLAEPIFIGLISYFAFYFSIVSRFG